VVQRAAQAMDGDDAPHAGDDSGKHTRIFAEIAAAFGAATKSGFTQDSKEVASAHPGHDTQVGAQPVG
jgi:hypothetical protein